MRKVYTIEFEEGLHARPATDLINIINKYNGDVFIEKDETKVDAKSMIQIMTLGVKKGDEIVIETIIDEQEALFSEIDELIKVV